MSHHRGPKTYTQDLLFYYDTGNEKSFAGKPTTNFFSNGHFSMGNGIPQESGSNPTNTIIQLSNPGNSPYVLRQNGNYTEYQINLSSQLSANTTYVMSGWYAESPDYNGSSMMFHSRAFSSSGNHIALGTGLFNVIKTVQVGGLTWRYCYATITTPSDYNGDFNWYVGYGQPSHNGYRYYTNLMMELGSYPSPFAYKSSINLIQNTNLTTWGTQSGVSAQSTTLVGATGKQDVYKINFGSYGGGDAIGTSITGVIGKTYTFSGWVRADSNTSGYITIGRANSNPSSQQSMSITTTWQRFEVTYTLNTNTTLYHNFAGQNTSYYVSGLEVNANERTNTESLFDLTKKTSLTTAHVSFDSNGMVAFDGTNDYIDIGKTPTQLGMYNSSYTAEVFCYPTNLSGDRCLFGTDQTAYRQGLHLTLRNGQIYMGHYSADYAAGYPTINAWNHIIFRYNASSSTASTFLNGELQGSGTIASFIGTTNVYVGREFGNPCFVGYIPVARIYGRYLNNDEIKRNYLALKSRFGL